MRRWRKDAIEFYIKSVNSFNIKSLSVVAFNESMEYRVLLLTVLAIVFIIYTIDAQLFPSNSKCME